MAAAAAHTRESIACSAAHTEIMEQRHVLAVEELAALCGKSVPDSVRILSKHLGDHAANDTVVSNVGSTTFILARSAEFRECALSSGLVHGLLRALNAHSASTPARHLCDAISNLAVSPAIQEALAGAGGIPLLIATLSAHAGDPAVAESACCALQNVADLPANQAAIGRGGGIPLISSVLTRHVDSSAVSGAACGALLNLADCAANLPLLARASVTPTLVAALVAHPHDAIVVEAACGALESIADGGQRQAILHTEAVDELVCAIASGLADRASLLARLNCIGRLVDFGQHNGSLARPTLVSILIGILSAHVADVEVAASAARALWYLSRHDDNKAPMLEPSVTLALSAALAVHTPCPMSLFCPISTIFNNITRTDSAKLAVHRTGYVGLAVRTITDHISDAAVCDSGLTALWCMSQVRPRGWCALICAAQQPTAPLAVRRPCGAEGRHRCGRCTDRCDSAEDAPQPRVPRRGRLWGSTGLSWWGGRARRCRRRSRYAARHLLAAFRRHSA